VQNLLLLLLCVLLFTTSDAIAARWGRKPDAISVVAILLVGPFAYFLFGYLAANTSLAKMGGYVNCGIVLCTALAGVAFFGERPSRTAWLAIGIIVSGLALLSVSRVAREGP